MTDRAFRALVRAFFAIDLRAHAFGRATGAALGELFSPLFFVVGQLIILTGLASAALFVRVDAAFFAHATLALTALLVFACTMAESDELVMPALDHKVLAHRPIAPRTFARARLVNALGFVALVTTACTVFPAIVGAAQRDADGAWLLLYAVASLVTGACAGGLALLVAAIPGQDARLASLKRVLAWTQIAGILVVFYGAQLLWKNNGGTLELLALEPPAWLAWSPLAPLAGAVAPASMAVRSTTLAGGALIACGLLALVARVLQLAWARATPAVAVPVALGVGARVLVRLLAAGRQERALARLIVATLARDADARAPLALALALPVTVIAAGIAAGVFADPAVVSARESALALASVPLFAACAPGLLAALAVHPRAHAARVLAFAPVSPRAAFARVAVRTARLAAMPFVIALAVAAALVWRQPGDAVAHAAVVWLALDVALRVGGRALPATPFSLPVRRGEAFGGNLGALLLASAWGSAVAVAWGAAAPDGRSAAALVLALCVADVVVAVVVAVAAARAERASGAHAEGGRAHA